MELTKTLVCCALVFVIMTEVVLCRPSRRTTEMDALVKDIDERLIRSEHKSSRRRRRHLQTRQLALMEYCLTYPHRCRQEVERLRRMRNQSRDFRVIVIEK
ncbi:uncharacterized protein LOC123554433 [Mercenaria mercenaria]|uniref:uncharacterized protein LOC123554433 n=1 Tax=Mercenaria mercenaria TaxID=6596 RepID=UPI001E1D47D3|nr:uncharacterized protein LOC123554433 [Mercenaria mercenaria]